MPKIDNMMAILWMLSSGNKVTAKQISEKLEINIRTVYRYIDTLSTSGVPIIADTGFNGGYTLLNNFVEAPLFFDAKEQAALVHAANFAKEAGYYGDESLNKAISKLSNYTNQNQTMSISQNLSSLEVINSIKSEDVEVVLKSLEQAISSGLSVVIQYHKSKEDNSERRQIDPYRIIYWNNRWYMIGYCHLRSSIRSFRVDRIEEIYITENNFEQIDDFSGRDFLLKNLLPQADNQSIIHLVLEGSKSTLNDVCKHWFLGNYLEKRTSNQATFILEKEILNTYVPHMLLPYGKAIEVIEPIFFKEKIVEVLSDLIKFHEKDKF